MTWPVENVGVVDTTMRVAAERALRGAPEGTTVVASEQTHGRGRRGRHWFSDPGLCFTTVLRPNRRADISTIGLVAGIAVQQALQELSGAKLGLKWPNDVRVKGRKLCGLLLESYNPEVVLLG